MMAQAIGQTLKTTYPCCGKPARIDVVNLVPRQKYVRVCNRCRRIWEVERTTLSEQDGMRIDRLDWEG
jgi:hypothetical protein